MYRKLVEQLRNTPSRSKRELMDKAADAIEKLEHEIRALVQSTETESKSIALRLRWNEKEKVFEEYKEPFMTVECPTKDDYNRLVELVDLGIYQRWISVKDRLPEDGVRVLTACDDGLIRLGISKGGFHSVVNREHRFSDVTHWMPLPEPPKERIDETILQQDELLKRRDALKGNKEG